MPVRAFRVTVASFNARALRVVTSLGFRPVSDFEAAAVGRRFEILVRPEVYGAVFPASGVRESG